MKYFEDFVVGETASYGNYEVTRAEVIEFAMRYDPQPFHLDDDAAAKTHFGRLSASGWHTAAMVMRMSVDHSDAARVQALGSPGIDALRWLRPVHPGDLLRVETTVREVRPSRSKSGIGSVHTDVVVFNQNDEPVMSMTSIVLIERRPQG